MRSMSIVFAGLGTAGLGLVLAGLGAASAEETAAASDPPSREALVELGRRLFMDPSASRLGRNSCASCHDPERGFSDPRPVSLDDAGPTRRHSQTLIDLAGEGFHWDGEFDSVRELLVARVAPSDQAAEARRKRIASRAEEAKEERDGRTSDVPIPQFYYGEDRGEPVTPVAERLAEDGRYAEAFAATFGSARPTTEGILDAMDAYCASIRSSRNAFDRFRAGDEAALSAAARRGLALFEGKAGCAQCHLTKSEDGRAPLTDGRFHDTGVSTRGEALAVAAIAATAAKKQVEPDRGLEETTFLAGNARKFKTPTLRDSSLHGPYMHDASFATLGDVVRYYSAGGTPHTGLDAAIRPLALTDPEVADVVAFLESLVGESRAGLGFSSPAVKPLRVRIVGLDGRPLRGFTFGVTPFGDRLLGEAPDHAAPDATTDGTGVATLVRPLATHVLLTSATYVLDLGRPIPDSCASTKLIATPRGKISVRIRRRPSYPGFPDEIRVWTRGSDTRRPAAVTLHRGFALGVDEVVYSGDGLPEGKRCACVVRVGLDDYDVTVDLAGGPIESIALRE